jgi:hypothetical protein
MYWQEIKTGEWNTEYGFYGQVSEIVFDPELCVYRTALRLEAELRMPDKKARVNGRALWATHILRMSLRFCIIY